MLFAIRIVWKKPRNGPFEGSKGPRRIRRPNLDLTGRTVAAAGQGQRRQRTRHAYVNLLLQLTSPFQSNDRTLTPRRGRLTGLWGPVTEHGSTRRDFNQRSRHTPLLSVEHAPGSPVSPESLPLQSLRKISRPRTSAASLPSPSQCSEARLKVHSSGDSASPGPTSG